MSTFVEQTFFFFLTFQILLKTIVFWFVTLKYIYVFKLLFTILEQEMKYKPAKDHLPRPAALHHIVEDFLTSWDGSISHILPLRR
jgi:hypothetical protein